MAERPEDLNLPNAVVARIIKDAIPEGVNVSKEARLAISKAASVFVLYATSCSNNFALKAKRKTISALDIISAMEDMEFEQFVEPLQQCLQAYRQGQKEKKEAAASKKKAQTEAEPDLIVPEGENGEANSEELISVGGDSENSKDNVPDNDAGDDSDVVEISDGD